MKYEPEQPKVIKKDWRYHLRFFRNWFLGLGFLTAFCLGYYNMCLDVWKDQDNEKIVVKAEELRVLKRDQAFVKAQTDRIVNAISNQTYVIQNKPICECHKRRHHHHGH